MVCVVEYKRTIVHQMGRVDLQVQVCKITADSFIYSSICISKIVSSKKIVDV